MGGSSAEAPTNPEAIRASNEEREEAASELGKLFAEGRLSHETFMQRVDEALGARDRRQLDRLFTDVPRRRPGAGTLAALRASLSQRASRGRAPRSGSAGWRNSRKCPMPCAETESRLEAYFDGELDALSAAEMERHIGECAECRGALDDLQKLRRSRSIRCSTIW